MRIALKTRLLETSARLLIALCASLYALNIAGCWAPFHSYAISASSLPEEFRTPYRTAGMRFNYSQLAVPPPADYRLGTGDMLEVMVPGLYDAAEINPLKVQVMSSGEIYLPLVGAVNVKEATVVEAQQAISKAYADGFLKEPRVNVTLFQKATVSVVVLGNVKLPGVHVLPKYENDVAHALAAAQGLSEDAADIVEVHRRRMADSIVDGHDIERLPAPVGIEALPSPCIAPLAWAESLPGDVVTIPLRGPRTRPVEKSEVLLEAGDVIVVPSRRHEVFYVVGQLRATNAIRFTAGERDRELGIGFVLPRDREIDVVTAVAMAGYIDPIDSPTTVTVHRVRPDGEPLLVRVDLIAARYNRCETILVEPGDIIYINPDAPWWLRRTFDRIIPDLLTIGWGDLFVEP